MTSAAHDRAAIGAPRVPRAGSAPGRSDSTAARTAAQLRERITEAHYPPGTQLSEGRLAEEFGVSRNTLREAFRLLTRERLLEHRLNRGVFVRVLSVEDITDIQQVRLMVECAALRRLGPPPYPLDAVKEAVAAGEAAAAEGRWVDCGTADIRFHQALAALAGSPRTDELMRGVLAELRLAFHLMGDPRRFHEPYLSRNREIVSSLERGDAVAAERLLGFYLEDSRRQFTEAYADRAARVTRG